MRFAAAYWHTTRSTGLEIFGWPTMVRSWENGTDSLEMALKRVPNSFGQSGRVDLREGLGREPKDMTITVSTPSVVYKDMLIVGSLVNEELLAALSYIRAFDLRTGSYGAPLMPNVGSSRGLAAC